MEVYRDYTTFIILGVKINLIAGNVDYGTSAVAEIDNKYYYLGEMIINLDAAIKGWQQANSRELTTDEFKQVLIDNEYNI